MGLTHNFHGKRGALNFFAVCGGGLKNFNDKYFLHQAPPYKCLWTVPNLCLLPFSICLAEMQSLIAKKGLVQGWKKMLFPTKLVYFPTIC